MRTMRVHSTASVSAAARGMSLVELMVGVAIGLIGLLVIFKTVAIWDSHTRTTTSGGDADTAGTLALFNLERDIKIAGMGIGTADVTAMNCNVTGTDSDGRAINFPLRPIEIIPGAAGAPDEIHVLHGNSSFFVSTELFNASTATTKRLQRRNGFKPGDLAVVTGSGVCQLLEVTDDSNPDGLSIGHQSGTYASFYAAASAAPATSRFNPAGGTGASTFSAGSIFSLGPFPQFNIWQIQGAGAGQALSRSDTIHNVGPFTVAEGVAGMKAQYGVDTDNNGRITDASPNEWTTTTPTDWTKVLAVRVAILVRSKQFEKSLDGEGAAAAPVTPNEPTWSGGSFVMSNLDGGTGTGGPNDWRYYRYRVYEKVIPLRNVIWGQ
jgi:type IV pilus assembly protein PilW